jgi:glycosyltransferase involved in cell wall biosynthesis
MPNLNVVATVYNGIDLNAFSYGPTSEDYLLWLGRVCDDKGTREAIEVAKMVGTRLCLAGKLDIHNPAYMAYYEREVVPHVDGDRVIFLGEVDQRYAAKLLRGAKALLNPIKWPEPFGLVMAEAMACGTPVIAFPNGSAPELVSHGETGFLVRDTEEMVDAVVRLDQIDRLACRQHVERFLSADTMVQAYESIYQRLASTTSSPMKIAV